VKSNKAITTKEMRKRSNKWAPVRAMACLPSGRKHREKKKGNTRGGRRKKKKEPWGNECMTGPMRQVWHIHESRSTKVQGKGVVGKGKGVAEKPERGKNASYEPRERGEGGEINAGRLRNSRGHIPHRQSKKDE